MLPGRPQWITSDIGPHWPLLEMFCRVQKGCHSVQPSSRQVDDRDQGDLGLGTPRWNHLVCPPCPRTRIIGDFYGRCNCYLPERERPRVFLERDSGVPLWYKRGMKLRWPLMGTFVAGYYLGAKAGERRYRQMRWVVSRAKALATRRARRSTQRTLLASQHAEVFPLAPALEPSGDLRRLAGAWARAFSESAAALAKVASPRGAYHASHSLPRALPGDPVPGDPRGSLGQAGQLEPSFKEPFQEPKVELSPLERSSPFEKTVASRGIHRSHLEHREGRARFRVGSRKAQRD
jgi:hypothetical protein